MVKFEFELTDDQAENLLDLIYEEILSRDCKKDCVWEQESNWWKQRAEYLKGIYNTILAGQTRIK